MKPDGPEDLVDAYSQRSDNENRIPILLLNPKFPLLPENEQKHQDPANRESEGCKEDRIDVLISGLDDADIGSPEKHNGRQQKMADS